MIAAAGQPVRALRASLAFAACVLAAWTASASLAPAQQAPAPAPIPVVTAPQWKEGAVWEYSDGYGLRVSSTNGVLTVFERTDAPGQWFSRYGFLRQDAVSDTTVRKTIYRTISPFAGVDLSSEPLTYRREYLRNGELVTHATSWTVEGREEITVPAGTFDCWIIVWRTRSEDSDWTGFERWWFSPELQHYARMEYRYGEMETRSRVLMRYSLPSDIPAGAPPALPGEELLSSTETDFSALDDAPLMWTAELVPTPIEVRALPPLDPRSPTSRSAALETAAAPGS